MHHGREARLGRAIRKARRAERAALDPDGAVRARAAIAAAVRWSLLRSGLDPDRAPALRVCDEETAALAAVPDTAGSLPAEQRTPPCGGGAPAGAPSRFDAAIGRLAARYRDAGAVEPDLARASLAELFAWCLARAEAAGSIPAESIAAESIIDCGVCC